MCDVSKTAHPGATLPAFRRQAADVALQMTQFPVDELARVLHVNAKLAAENYRRYQQFHAPDTRELPALLAYTGIVFKRLNPSDFSTDDWLYAQDHLLLTSFCYGLLRPLDAIRPYRLEGAVRLPGLDTDLFGYWRPLLTDWFIRAVRDRGGVLCNLASDEMRNLFDWKRVEREVTVVTPEFKVWKNGCPATVVIYTKMARGEMARFLLKERVDHPDGLRDFRWEGFSLDEELSADGRPVFTLGEP